MWKVELGEHAGHNDDGFVAGAEKRSADPAMRVGDVAEGGDVALETGEIFEVGGQVKEERVHALLLEHRVGSPSPGGVVEHGRLV